MNILRQLKQRIQKAAYLFIATITALSSIGILLSPVTVNAAQITNRKFTLSNSAGAAASVTYTFNSSALPTSGTPVQSVDAQVCDAPSGTCNPVSGFTSGSSTLASQPSGLGCATGWTNSTASTGKLRVTATCASNPSGAVTIAWNGVHNPTAVNLTFYLRVTTYSDTAWTTPLDTGVIASSTSQAIDLTATVDESITFCTGTSGITSTSCAGATGGSVPFGSLSASSTKTGTSQLGVGTNGVAGYVVTVNGSTLTCSACAGTPTITAMGTQTANGSPATASIGTAQFGLNLRDNATPNIGTDKAGGSGAYGTNYGTVDNFRFLTGDSVASTSASSDLTLFTVSYVVNIPTSQAAGAYTATMTYIATATF